MPRLVLVHGSITNGAATWGGQRELADRYDLVVLDRPGFPGGPPVERVDFEADARWLAELLRPGDHLCGHSYGGIVCLLAAVSSPALASLTAIEPPATRVAEGDPAADAFAASEIELWRNGPRDPEEFLRVFLGAVGSAWTPPSPLTPALEQGTRALMAERGPWEAEIPLAELRALAFPKLVVSGAHHAAFDAICDVLEREIEAGRAVLPGAGHAVQRAPGFNDVLADFLARAESSRFLR